jgi:hypothetical protein
MNGSNFGCKIMYNEKLLAIRDFKFPCHYLTDHRIRQINKVGWRIAVMPIFTDGERVGQPRPSTENYEETWLGEKFDTFGKAQKLAIHLTLLDSKNIYFVL